MKFLLFRYNLAPVEVGLFSEEVYPERKASVLKLLSEPHNITVHEVEYAFRFKIQLAENIIVCEFGKRREIERTRLTTDGFVKESIEEWPISTVIFNISSSTQILAVQETSGDANRRVGLIEDMFNIFLVKLGWRMSIRPILDSSDFWREVEANNSNIESIEFKYDVPNWLNARGDLPKLLKSARDHFSAQQVGLKIENNDGNLTVPEKNEFIEESVKQVSAGAGKWKLKVRGTSSKIQSGEFTKTVIIDEIEYEGQSEEDRAKIIEQIGSMLK